MINNIDEPWDGHSYEVVESFIKDELKGKYTKTEDYSPGSLPVFSNDGEIVSSDISVESLISKNDGPVADWDEDNPYDTAYIKNKPVLSAVAKTGNYEDLSGKPSLSKVAHTGDYYDLSNKPSLARVAISGSYNDLTNKPETTQVNADWLSNNGPSAILNKPNLSNVATSGDYYDLTNKPEIPTDVSELTNDAGYITSGDIPPQMNADWNATGGPAEILNKPNDVGDFTNDIGYITNADIPTDVSAFVNDAGYLTSDALTPITEVIPSNASSTNKLADKNYVNTGLSSKASVDSVETSFNSLETRIDLEKQNKLVDGVNIKTINGEPILGEGNIEIQRGANGLDAVNPFKGWFDNSTSLETEYPDPSVGDYAYVKETDSVHIWRCGTAGEWSDSMFVFNPSNNQSFRTGEELNEVGVSDNIKDGSHNDIAKASSMTSIFSEIGDDTFVETKVYNESVVNNYYVSSIDGNLVEYDYRTSYAEYEIQYGEKLRFLGIKVNVYKISGYAFGYYTEENDQSVWHTIDSFRWDYDPYMENCEKHEYIADIPEGSTHFRVTCKISEIDNSSDVYCYVRNGMSVQDKIDEMNGYVRVIDSVDATRNNKIENAWETVSGGAVTTYSSSSGQTGIGWRLYNLFSSRVVNLKKYIENGYSRIKIFADKENDSSYTFTTSLFDSNSTGRTSYDNVQTYAFLSQLSTQNVKDFVSAGEVKIIDFPKNCDALYLYFTARGNSTYENSTLPLAVEIQKIEKNNGTILKNSNRYTVSQSSTKPTPPKLNQLKWNGSYMENSERVLTTDAIYGDFVCVLNKEYKINRVMYVNQNGEIVNENIATENIPAGVIDGWASGGRQTYGSCWRPLQCGVVIEVSKINSEEKINSRENIYKNFYWLDDMFVRSELITNPHYNGETYADGNGKIEDMYFTKDSVRSALKRAKIVTMIPWKPLRYVMATNKRWRHLRGTPYTYELGVPYSRSNCKDTWFGFEISPYTFLSAMSNPYSIVYTDKIGYSSYSINSVDKSNGSDLFPFTGLYSKNGPIISEYGIMYGTRGSEHGVPVYGLVCSAFGSFLYGYSIPIGTNDFPKDGDKNFKLETHGHGAGVLNYPVMANDIPPLTIITNEGHTYAIIDFYLDKNGNRIAAVVAESTSPNTRVGLYPIERLQKRFDVEYDYYNGNIYVTIIKPSVLEENKDKNLWDVNDLYQTESVPLLGNCDFSHSFPKNIMFYMGDKAVIVRRNKEVYAKNEQTGEWLDGVTWNDNLSASYVIVKPDNLYTHLVLEKWSRGINGEWIAVQDANDNDVVLNLEEDGVMMKFQNQANENDEYFKVNLNNYIPYGPGKYRAYLTYEKYDLDGSTVTVKSDATQWVVLAGDIYLDPDNNSRAIWISDSMNENLLDESNENYSPDEYATPVFATTSTERGDGGTPINAEKNAENGYVSFGSGTQRVKVGFACKWGVATRRAIAGSIPKYEPRV